MIDPVHAEPSAMNDARSNFDAVVVMVGAVPPGHFTLVNVPVNPPAPVRIFKIKDCPDVAVGMVKVQLPVSVTVWNVPFASDMVLAVPLFPIATVASV